MLPLALVGGLLILSVGVPWWFITYVGSAVRDAVRTEETARIAEVHEQSTQRVADMQRLASAIETLNARVMRTEEEGTPHSNSAIAEIRQTLRVEKAEREGVDAENKKAAEDMRRRMDEDEAHFGRTTTIWLPSIEQRLSDVRETAAALKAVQDRDSREIGEVRNSILDFAVRGAGSSLKQQQQQQK